MRIGIDARLYWQTGVGRYIRNLIYWLNREDRENQYVVFTGKDSHKNIPISSRWKTQQVDIKWHTFAEQAFFPLILTKNRLDLIHFPYFSVPIFYPGKFVVTIHDLTNLYFATGRSSTLPYAIYKFKYFGYRLVLKTTLIRAERLIVPSYTVASEIKKTYPYLRKKVVVTYEGGIEEVAEKQTKLDFEPFFLYVGNVYPHKNIENAILAIKRINKLHSQNFKFVIVSKKDFFQKRLQKFVHKINLGKRIIFLEGVDDFELSNLYKRAICLIFPSFSEGFGLPALEAMQNGCLIAASDIPVFHEICEDLPFYFNPNDINDIAETVEKIISLDLAQKKVLQNEEKKRASQFSWMKMVKQTLKIYKEVVK